MFQIEGDEDQVLPDELAEDAQGRGSPRALEVNNPLFLENQVRRPTVKGLLIRDAGKEVSSGRTQPDKVPANHQRSNAVERCCDPPPGPGR